MENLEIYNAVRKVPDNAQRKIEAGRLKGKTDINPMWRIKALTEQFGPCGFGWRYEILDKHMEKNPESAEIAAFVDINLYVKMDGEWSAAIPGTGGSAFVTEEKSGLHTNDECYKMALTDAISVACKSLGFGANVYWEKDSESKYTKPTKSDNPLKGNDHLALEEKKLKPMDVFDLPGAANVDNKTLFVNALQIAQLTNEQGAEILNGMFGKSVKINELSAEDFRTLISALE
jgi:hypothetical protein